MACAAEEGSKEDPDAIPHDVVGYDSVNHFTHSPAWQLTERNSSSSMREREHNKLEWNGIWLLKGCGKKSTREVTEIEIGINRLEIRFKQKACEYESI